MTARRSADRPPPERTDADPGTAAAHTDQAADETSVWRVLLELPVLLALAGLIAFLLKTFLIQAFFIPSGSMLPQLQIDDRVVVSKLSYVLHEPRRGDIVVFDDPSGASRPEPGLVGQVLQGVGLQQPSTDEFIKRVVALPGETVEGRGGHVYVNGRRLVEPYLPEGAVTADFEPRTVGAGELWVMGDNRGQSADSRTFGPIDDDTVVGRAFFRIWPLPEAAFL